jgi:hypothetical protein
MRAREISDTVTKRSPIERVASVSERLVVKPRIQVCFAISRICGVGRKYHMACRGTFRLENGIGIIDALKRLTPTRLGGVFAKPADKAGNALVDRSIGPKVKIAHQVVDIGTGGWHVAGLHRLELDLRLSAEFLF